MSRKSRKKALRTLQKDWHKLTEKGRCWTREQLVREYGVKMSDVSKLISKTDPSRLMEDLCTRGQANFTPEEWHPRLYRGRAPKTK